MICFCNKSLNKLVYLPQFLTYNQSKYHNLFEQTNPNILISLCKPIQINLFEHANLDQIQIPGKAKANRKSIVHNIRWYMLIKYLNLEIRNPKVTSKLGI
jgi:hypothetical protein